MSKAGIVTDEVGTFLGKYVWLQKEDQRDLDSFCESWLETYKENNKFFITLDLETSNLRPKDEEILLVSISWDGQHSIIFCPAEFELTKFKEVLNTVPLSNQNLKFDLTWLIEKYDVDPIVFFDTMVAAQLGWAGGFPGPQSNKFGLLNLAKQLLEGLVLEKETRNEFIGRKISDGFTQKQIEYAVKDSIITHKLVFPIMKRLYNENLWEVWEELEKPLISIFAKIQLRGIKVNVKEIEKLLALKEKQLFDIYTKIIAELAKIPDIEKLKFTKGTFNPGSSPQIISVLDLLNIKLKDTTKETMLSAKAVHSDPILGLIIEHRKIKSEISKFLNKWLEVHVDPDTECIYANFNTNRAESGRMCVDSSTLIETSNGPIKIIDIIPGHDEALTHQNRYKPISNLIYKGKEEMFEVELENGNKIICTKEHRFFSYYVWVSLSKLSIGSSLNIIDSKELHSKIKSIKSLGVRDVWDITVQDDHSYIAHGFINHNSGSDPNLQQVPPDLRSMFIARPGYKILSLDYSAFEMRAAAGLTEEKYLLDSFSDRARLLKEIKPLAQSLGQDIETWTKDQISNTKNTYYDMAIALEMTDVHRRNGSLIFDIPIENVDSKIRTVSKTLGYTMLYGGGPNRIREALAEKDYFYSLAQCQQFQEDFFNKLPKIKKFIEEAHKRVLNPGFAQTIMGRRRYFDLPPRWKSREFAQAITDCQREILNYYFQACNADAVKKAMVDCEEYFSILVNRPYLLIPVHDELVLELPENKFEEYGDIIEGIMVNAGKLSVGNKVEIECSRSKKLDHWSK
jgi:DNA polymerase I-like protein with 3'-5' exonuclease and polymerase domains